RARHRPLRRRRARGRAARLATGHPGRAVLRAQPALRRLGGAAARSPRAGPTEGVGRGGYAPGVTYTVLPPGEAFWRPSNQRPVLTTDLAKQLGAQDMGARLWRLRPGEASTKHKHRRTVELYVVLDGEGTVRIDDDLLRLPRLSALLVQPESVRQLF